MTRKAYSTDLTDAQWALIEAQIPAAKPGRRPRVVDLREVVNAILYLLRTGCSWRLDGTWDRIHDALRERVRVKAGRAATPSAAIVDSQSVKTTEKGGRAGMTPASRSAGENATSSSTPSV